MTLTIAFTDKQTKSIDTAVVPVFEDKKLSAEAQKLDKACGGHIAHALKNSRTFSGKHGETLALHMAGKSPFAHIILAGLGNPKTLTAVEAENAGGKIFPAMERYGAPGASVLIAAHKNLALNEAELAAHFAAGFELRSYKFNKYRSKKPKEKDKSFTRLELVVKKPPQASKLYKRLKPVTQGVFLARDLVNEPPNAVFPEDYASRIAKELRPLGVKVEILDEKKMAKLGMGAILAVGQGSDHKPRMVTMEWNGTGSKKGKPPVALVGKGVTFDTGGISIKPAAGMEEMKMDMGGSATVVGTIMTLALRKAKVHVVGIVGLAENMLSGNAYRPADIITSYSGKTIEVLNTDAEGRLVLADALTYVQEKYKPGTIIDLATLTGAMLVALGFEYCGTFANDNDLWNGMEKASFATGEKLWRMPLDDVWRRDMEGSIADLQNLGKSGRFAGSCTAAGFLEHFIDKGVKWAHMDIAGTAWIKSDRPTVPRNGTGFGVRLLDRLIADTYEKK